MKKVWILEKYQEISELERQLKEMEELFEENKEKFDANGIETMEKTLGQYRKLIEENPEGYWSGTEGKSIYRQFCEVAKDCIRRHPKGTKFRVVEGEIKDDAKYWTGYKFVKENEGVLKYLMATK